MLTIGQIVEWLLAHVSRYGRYPTTESGLIDDAGGETWRSVNTALVKGQRGLPAGENLAELRLTLIRQGKLPDLSSKTTRRGSGP